MYTYDMFFLLQIAVSFIFVNYFIYLFFQNKITSFVVVVVFFVVILQ